MLAVFFGGIFVSIAAADIGFIPALIVIGILVAAVGWLIIALHLATQEK